jgi:hypothetical protein
LKETTLKIVIVDSCWWREARSIRVFV